MKNVAKVSAKKGTYEEVAKAGKAMVKELKKPKIELVTYEMKMVIPTGQYANIQPCIIVKGGSMQDVHDFIAPHMNKLWKEYYMVSERRNEPITTVKELVERMPATDISPVSTVAFLKANQAIGSCLGIEALDLIAAQVEKSVKLDRKDKDELFPIIQAKRDELNTVKNG